jgi:hypothetical protein
MTLAVWTILRMLGVMCVKVPPFAPRMICVSVSKNVPAAPGLVVRRVLPSRVRVELDQGTGGQKADFHIKLEWDINRSLERFP